MPLAVTGRRQRTRIPAAVWKVLGLTAGIYLTFGVITILEPLYVRQVLHGPFTTYGWLLAVWGLAGILTCGNPYGAPSSWPPPRPPGRSSPPLGYEPS